MLNLIMNLIMKCQFMKCTDALWLRKYISVNVDVNYRCKLLDVN